MALRISCINKDKGNHENPYEAITRFGWINELEQKGSYNLIEMYNFVKAGGTAYVTDNNGNKAMLICAKSQNGNPYVKTVADYTKGDNLLKLPECGIFDL